MNHEEAVPLSTGAPVLEYTSLLSDTEFLEALRRQMLKFATLQLSDPHLAEDAVQEALIGALRNAKSFGGRAALKTWVFAILKNKIADVLRQKQRLIDASSLMHEDEEDEDFSALFDKKGFWQTDERPVAWGNPEESFREGQFWRVFEACLENLPGKQARVFMMREFVELDSHEICATVGITVSNLNVMLHRARIRLRECLENRWFLEGEQSC
jgi:RNA polymerase sigma-70 factor (TIGR02943 family)